MIDPKKIEEWKALAERVALAFFQDIEQDDPGDLAEAVSALLAEREQMLALLREVETGATDCPICRKQRAPVPIPKPRADGSWSEASIRRYVNTQRPPIPHAPDCRLAAFLKGT